MMTPYSEALETLIRTQRDCVQIISQLQRLLPNHETEDISNEVVEIQEQANILALSQPMYWAREPLALILNVAKKIEIDTAISPHLLYSPFAWCWFEAPAIIDPTLPPVTAISWAWVRLRDVDGERETLRVTSWEHDQGRYPHMMQARVMLSEGRTLRDGQDEVGAIGVQLFQFVIAAGAFLRTKIAATESRALERHARKRVSAADWQGAREVEVVLLRQRESAPAHGERLVDWQCRWPVSAHPRQQWYPSKQTHLPIIVAPYLKGPEGKPLKMPSGKIFAVTR